MLVYFYTQDYVTWDYLNVWPKHKRSQSRMTLNDICVVCLSINLSNSKVKETLSKFSKRTIVMGHRSERVLSLYWKKSLKSNFIVFDPCRTLQGWTSRSGEMEFELEIPTHLKNVIWDIYGWTNQGPAWGVVILLCFNLGELQRNF